MALFIAILLLACILGWVLFAAFKQLGKIGRYIAQALFPLRNTQLFDNSYIDVNAFYIQQFRKVPCISFVDDVDVSKVFEYINGGYAGKVTAVYQRNWYNWQQQRQEFSRTVFKLADKTLIELGHNYAEILYNKNNYAKANRLIDIFTGYKTPAKEEAYEINIITFSNNSLDLRRLEIKPTMLDVDLYYNDDFKEVDALIKSRLAKDNDKGIILLHGLPGTGKTTYLRYLIGNMKKKVLFVSPGVAGNLMNPEFIDLLISNPDSVLVIEDAENIIMDRKYNSGSNVSNLLNISDGLLSDCLNVQIICTFNSALNMVDSALLRKGRLIAKYEFGKLGVYKARRLSAHLGLNQVIDQPVTLAEITNPEETYYEPAKVQVIGFRRELVEN